VLVGAKVRHIYRYVALVGAKMRSMMNIFFRTMHGYPTIHLACD
jgi:hypothetical protein